MEDKRKNLYKKLFIFFLCIAIAMSFGVIKLQLRLYDAYDKIEKLENQLLKEKINGRNKK